jgi:hypothetical protein
LIISLQRIVLALRWSAILAISCIATSTFSGQDSFRDIKTVYNGGRVHGHEYRNDYFGITLTVEEAEFTAGSFLSADEKRARLVDAVAKKFEDRYEIAILADQLSANPAIHSAEQYLRSVRHGLEREGEQTVDEKFTLEITGVQFVGATLKVTEDGVVHYRGIFTTLMKGYILNLDVAAATPERTKLLAKSKVRFDTSVVK